MTATPSEMPLHIRRNGFDPVDELGRVRDEEGVCLVETGFGRSAYLVTRYADVREVLADSQRFSNVIVNPLMLMSGVEEAARQRAGNLLAWDPPEHTRLRRLLTPAFVGKRLRQMESRIVEIVDDQLNALAAAGPPADLVAQFALPIPSLVICELLGVPYEDRADFQTRATRQLDMTKPVEESLALAREGQEYMSGLVARAQAEPRDDLLGMLIREHGNDLDTDELTGVASLLLLAGHETTANMLGLGTLALLQHPAQLAAVRDDAEAVEAAVEELLRWISIVPAGMPRTTTVDVEIAGHRIPAGELVVCALPAANRDPQLVEDPDRLDLSRGAPGHLAFGHGVHHCIGAPLARMEMRIAFPALLRRFPRLALAVPDDQISFRAHHAVFGVLSLPVTW
jgi:cytochrome P450